MFIPKNHHNRHNLSLYSSSCEFHLHKCQDIWLWILCTLPTLYGDSQGMSIFYAFEKYTANKNCEYLTFRLKIGKLVCLQFFSSATNADALRKFIEKCLKSRISN